MCLGLNFVVMAVTFVFGKCIISDRTRKIHIFLFLAAEQDLYDYIPSNIFPAASQVRIEQSLPGTKNIILYDLPGLIANPKDDNMDNELFVQGLAAWYLRRPQTVPVVICAMKGSIDEIGERRELHELATGSRWNSAGRPRPDWASTAIFVVNRFGHHLRMEFQDATAVTEFFRQVQDHEKQTGTKYHFVALKQSRTENQEEDWGFDEAKNYYSNLVEKERAFLEEEIASMPGGADFSQEFFATLLGLKAAQAAVHERIQAELLSSLPKTREALLVGRTALQQEWVNLDAELKLKNRKVAKGLIASFLQHFQTHFQHLVSADQIQLKKNVLIVEAEPNGR